MNKQVYNAKSIAIIGLLSSLAAVSRFFFSSIPSVQPSSFIIIMTGIVFGGSFGGLTGALCAVVSNILLGQGPWTLFQIVCWGLMGLTADWFSKLTNRNIIALSIFGFIWGMVFGWIMNIWYAIGDLNWVTYISACIASLNFDLAHALTNMLLITLFGRQCINILEKTRKKL